MADNSKTTIHFTVDKAKKDTINEFKEKIEALFEVKLEFDEENVLDKSGGKQWMSVGGKSCDCQDAKDYIMALCYPNEKVQVCCKCDDDDLKYEIFEGIEKNTRAVILEQENDLVEICGSVYSVTLALSSLEELLGAKLQSTEADKDSGSKRLDNVLRETISHIDDVDNDVDDYESVPSNVKRAMIDSILHEKTLTESDIVQDEDLFDDGILSVTEEKRKTSFTKGLKPTCSTASSCTPVGNNGESKKNRNDSNHGDLRRLAESVGYSRTEIEEGLLYVSKDTTPSDFLPMLIKIRERKQELGLLPKKQKVDDDTDVEIVGVTPPSVDKHKAENTPQNINDMSIVEISDEEEINRLESLPSRPRTRNSTGEKKTDVDQTSVMSVWKQHEPSKGAIPKSKSTLTARSSKSMNQSTSTSSALNNGSQSVAPKTSTESSLQNLNPELTSTGVLGGDRPVVDRPVVDRPVVDRPVVDRPVREQQNDAAIAMNVNGELRYVVIDGSNVAKQHGNGTVFSCRGIKLCVDYFLKRGHKKITVFVPGWRQKRGTAANPITNQDLLEKMVKDGYLVFTPHKQLPSGKRVASYDDRFILDLADKEDGVIVSNDQYKDFFKDKASYRRLIEERCIGYVFVGDNFMLPEDPYGQHGPSLNEILIRPRHRTRPIQDYNRQSFDNPFLYQQHQQQQLMNQQLQQHYQQQQMVHRQNRHHYQSYNYKNYSNDRQCYQYQQQDLYYRRRENTRSQTERHERPVASIAANPYHSAPQIQHESESFITRREHQKRLENETLKLFEQLKVVFCEKDQEPKIMEVLNNHSSETDINKLTNYCLNALT